MILKLIELLIASHIRTALPTSLSWIISSISNVFSVLILYWTSLAIGENFSNLGTSYFYFVLIGEMSITVFSSLIQDSVQLIQGFHRNGLLSYFLSLPRSLATILSTLLLSKTWRHFIYFPIQFALAFWLSNGEFSLFECLVIVIMTILCLPLGMCIAFLGMSIVIRFGRGASFLMGIFNVAGLISGAYFPLLHLENWLQKFFKLNPFTYVVELSRSMVMAGATLPWLKLILLVLTGVGGTLIAILIFQKQLAHFQKNDAASTFV